MKNIFKKYALTAGIIAALFGASVAVASTLPLNPPVFETYLASQQLTTDTSLTLASETLRDATTLSGYVCLTIDSNSSSLEYECGTLSGTSVTGITRGIDAVTGTTSVAALEFTHRRGADVKITDYPILTIIDRMISGQDTLPVALHYTTGTTISSSDSQALVNVQLLNNTAFLGAPNASTILQGIIQIATAAQAALGTSVGSTGALLGLPASLATSTPGVQVTNVIPVTGTNEKISQAFLDLSQPFTFNSAFITNASSTNATTTNETVTGTLTVNNIKLTGTIGGVSALSTSNFEAAASLVAGQAVYSGFGASDGGIVISTFGTQGANSGSINAGSGANRVLVAISNDPTNGASITGMTYAGISLTRVDNDTSNSNCNGANLGNCSSWILVNPASGSNTLLVSVSAGTSHTYFSVLANAAQSGQPAAHGVSGGCKNSTATQTSTTNGSVVVAAITATSTQGASTALWENAAADNLIGGDSGLVYPANTQVNLIVGNTSQSDCFFESIAPANPPVQGVLPASSNLSSITTLSQFINSFSTFVGFALGSASFGQPVSVQTDGIFATTSLAALPSQYYLNDALGSIGTTPGTNTRKVGVEASTTALIITNNW